MAAVDVAVDAGAVAANPAGLSVDDAAGQAVGCAASGAALAGKCATGIPNVGGCAEVGLRRRNT